MKRAVTRRTALLGTTALLALALLLALLLVVPASHTGFRTVLNKSSEQTARLLGANLVGSAGLGPLNLAREMKDPRCVVMRTRLLLGEKLYRLVTSSASLGELAVALGWYANYEVVVPDPTGKIFTTRLGAFNSDSYSTRWQAARAIEQVLKGAGWRVARLTDGKLVIVSERDFQRLRASPPPASILVPPKPTPSSRGESGSQYE